MCWGCPCTVCCVCKQQIQHGMEMENLLVLWCFGRLEGSCLPACLSVVVFYSNKYARTVYAVRAGKYLSIIVIIIIMHINITNVFEVRHSTQHTNAPKFNDFSICFVYACAPCAPSLDPRKIIQIQKFIITHSYGCLRATVAVNFLLFIDKPEWNTVPQSLSSRVHALAMVCIPTVWRLTIAICRVTNVSLELEREICMSATIILVPKNTSIGSVAMSFVRKFHCIKGTGG